MEDSKMLDELIIAQTKAAKAQIKTGLKLSEAVKLLEESPGALITIHDSTYDWLTYDYLFNSSLAVIYKKSLWSVKLPPPMPPRAVSVTRTDVFDAVESTDISMLPHKELAEKLCRKLGL